MLGQTERDLQTDDMAYYDRSSLGYYDHSSWMSGEDEPSAPWWEDTVLLITMCALVFTGLILSSLVIYVYCSRLRFRREREQIQVHLQQQSEEQEAQRAKKIKEKLKLVEYNETPTNTYADMSSKTMCTMAINYSDSDSD